MSDHAEPFVDPHPYLMLFKIVGLALAGSAITIIMYLGFRLMLIQDDPPAFLLWGSGIALGISLLFTLRQIWFFLVFIGSALLTLAIRVGPWPTVIACILFPILIPLLLIGNYYQTKIEELEIKAIMTDMKRMREQRESDADS